MNKNLKENDLWSFSSNSCSLCIALYLYTLQDKNIQVKYHVPILRVVQQQTDVVQVTHPEEKPQGELLLFHS